MTVMETDKQTGTVFTVQPFAAAPVDGDAGDLIDAVLSALEQDARALGPVVAYDYDTGRIDAIFQVEVGSLGGVAPAADEALNVFNAALAQAGATFVASALSVVEGDDPELLP